MGLRPARLRLRPTSVFLRGTKHEQNLTHLHQVLYFKTSRTFVLPRSCAFTAAWVSALPDLEVLRVRSEVCTARHEEVQPPR